MHWIRVGSVIASTFAAAALLPPNLAQARENPFSGRWHLNKALSALPLGEAAPADLVTDIQRGQPACAVVRHNCRRQRPRFPAEVISQVLSVITPLSGVE
jgi:hypothetical protein